MGTKKALAPFDLQMPNKIINGFLYPNVDSEQIDSFLEINKDKEWSVGMVVFLGREITKNDLFVKIVDSGKKIKSVNNLLENLEEYIKQVSQLKIGDIVGIRSLENGFQLIKLKKPYNLEQ